MDVLAEQPKSNQNYHVESTIHELLDLENLILKKHFLSALSKHMTIKQWLKALLT